MPSESSSDARLSFTFAPPTSGTRRDELTPDTRRREREALEALVTQVDVTPTASTIDSTQQAHDCIGRLNQLLGRLHMFPEAAMSPGEGFAFVPVDKAIAYVEHVKHRYEYRVTFLRHREQMAAIEEAVEAKVKDPDARRELSDMVAEIGRQQQQVATSMQAQEELEAGELARLTIMKHRWEVRKAMLEREPAAVLVGGVLLVGIAAALVIAMFAHTPVPEILSSGFLLILGFFFGQNSTRTGSSG